MTAGRGSSGKSGRVMTDDEAELWTRVSGSVDKVRVKQRVPAHKDDVPAAPAAPKRSEHPASRSKPQRTPDPVSATPAAPPPASRLKPMAEFDRRAMRQVTSGKTPIDSRIDLHGMRQRDAHVELTAFLRAAQARGCRTVLVITGKGDPASERDYMARALGKPQRGVLRHSVPRWLDEPELRTVVLSYTVASARHGGGGALYVQLRKRRP